MTTDEQKSRDAFEEHMRWLNMTTNLRRYVSQPQGYKSKTVSNAWDQWVCAWQASRRAALEEAAQVCEEVGDEYGESEGGRWPELKSDAQTGARNCESAIRSLADNLPAAPKE